MKIIHKYLLREISTYTGMAMISVMGIYAAVDFFERVDNFLEADLPITRALLYLAYKLPFIMAQVLPVCILLSVVIAVGMLNKHYELIALRCSGVSVYSLLKPVLIIGAMGVFFLFFFSEVVVPFTSHKANRIWMEDVKQSAIVVSKEHNIWLKDKQRIIFIKYFNKSDKTLFGVVVYNFDSLFRLVNRLDARKAEISMNNWTLHDVMEQSLNKESGTYDVTLHDTYHVALNVSLKNLETVLKKPEEMSFKELSAYAKKVESEGYDATRHRVDLYAKISFPFVCIVLCIIGTIIGSRPRSREGLSSAVAYGISITFLYWICFSFCISLGYARVLPPLIAAWVTNFLFACLSVFLLMNGET